MKPEQDQLALGRVRRRTKGFYYLFGPEGDLVECKAKGSLFKTSRYDNQIAVGDEVLYLPQASGEVGLIHSIQPRKSFLSRARVGIEAEQVIAANVDRLILVQAARDPKPRANFLFRMLIAASRGQVEPILLFTKSDLMDEGELDEFLAPFKALDLEIHFTSNKGTGDEALFQKLLQGKISVLSGPSGVGKSSLLNRLYPGLNIKVGEVSDRTKKGSHTTTSAEMHQVAQSTYVIDTPGIREFGFWGLDAMNLHEFFPGLSIYQGQCHHRDCRHLTEPGCAAKQALEAGELHRAIYAAYQSILREL